MMKKMILKFMHRKQLIQVLVDNDKKADGAEENRKKNRGDATKDYNQKVIDKDLVSQMVSEENN